MDGVRAYTARKPMRILFILFLIVFIMYPVSAIAPLADFTSTPTTGATPLSVTFTDLSTNTPTGWSWFFGDEDYSGAWTQVNGSSGWTARDGHTSIALPDRSIVLLGGSSGGIRKNDVWRSTDNGATWTQANASAAWTGRYGHSSVAMPDGSIVLMGGYDGSYQNDVWLSADNGLTWTQINASAGWTGRSGQSSVAMADGSIVLMGGWSGGIRKNDVWRSMDNGVTWAQMNASAGWTGRYGHSSVAISDGSIVLLGGNDGSYRNDVWLSTNNGVTWTQMNASAGWTGRSGHSSVVMADGSIVLMGGTSAGMNKNDVWRSMDNGATWTKANASAGWTGRYGHSSVAISDGNIVLLGGNDGNSLKNDTWRYNPAGSSVQNPSHTYSTTGTYSVTLQASNADGSNSTTKSGYVTVTALPAPNTAFSGTPITGNAPLAVTFTDLSTNTPTGWSWFFGDEDYSGAWTKVNNSAGWSARKGHAGVVLPDGNIVIIGGEDGFGYRSDIWISADKGATWTQQAAASGWSPRYVHSSVVMPNGSILLIGGDDGNLKNDVWISTDKGATWTQQTNTPGWTARSAHSSVVLPDNSILVLGGYDGGTVNDVWRSTDNGTTWTQQTAAAGWTGRFGHSGVVLPDESIVIMGGNDGATKNDVWRSTDNGATWMQQTAAAEWSEREYFNSIAMPDGSIVIMGGEDSLGNPLNDVWRSMNKGIKWTEVNATAGWTERHCFSGVTMPDGSIIIMGGYDGGSKRNDVWRMQPVGSSLQNPSHTYTTAGTYTVALQAYNDAGWNASQRIDYINVTIGPPMSNFTGTPTEGTAPLQVNFTDKSTGSNIATWLWHFGDGNSSTAQNPVYTYGIPGTYTVNLTATNAGGSNTTERIDYINVTKDPTVTSATTNADGTQITVTFSKAMADPAGKHAQFGYQINGGGDQTFSAAVLDADTTKITLTCSGTAISHGNAISLHYTAGDVTAGDGGILATFIGQAVTNAMPAPAPAPSDGGGSEPAPAAPPVQPAPQEIPVEAAPEEPAEVPQEILPEEKTEVPPEVPMEAPVIDMAESFSEGISSSINNLKASLRSGGRDSSGAPLHTSIPAPAESIIPHDAVPVAAVATGVVVSAGSAFLAGFFSGGGGGAGSSFGSGWFSSFLKRLGNIVSEFIGEEALELFGERKTIEPLRPKKAGDLLILGMTRNNLIVIISGAIIYAAAFMFADGIGLDPMLILIYLLIVGIALIAHELAHMMIAMKYNIESKIRIYPAGTIASIVTGIFFGNVFGQPLHMKVMEKECHTETEKGLTMLAGPGVNILLGTAFLFMIPVGGIWLMIGRLGFVANMIEGLFSMIPCKPMDGKSIKKWSAIIWAGLFIPWIILYFILYVI